jgi:valyl-tRNA synthetase
VDAIRNIRGEMNVPFKIVLEDVEIGSLDREAAGTVREELVRIHRLANVRDAVVHADGAAPSKRPASAVAVGAGFEVRVGLAGAVDVAAELARIVKEIDKIEGDLGQVSRKLENPSFVQKAPPEVVEKDRARADELREKRRKLEAHRAMLAGTLDSPGASPGGRREAMENENQNPGQPSQPSSSQPMTQQAMDTMEKVVTTVSEVGKAIGTAVTSGVEAAVERVKAARASGRKASAAKKKAKARKAAPRRAAKKAGKKKAAKKTAKKTARRGAKKKVAKKRGRR